MNFKLNIVLVTFEKGRRPAGTPLVLLMSDGRKEQKTGRRLGAAGLLW